MVVENGEEQYCIDVLNADTWQYEGTKPAIVKTTSELSTTVQKLGIRVGEGLQSFCQDGFLQVDRSCAKARRAFAEKFGLGQKFEALKYAILSQYYDSLRITHFLEIFGEKSAF